MKNLFAGALLIFMSMPAMADQPSYNFFQLSWQNVEFDDDFVDVDGDGFGLGGSFEVGDNWHIIAAYTDTGLDFGIDLSQFSIGGGWHTAMSENASFFANLVWVTAEADASGFASIDDSGIGASIGIRGFASEKIELEGSITYVDLDDFGDGTAFEVGGWYLFNETFALGLLAAFEDDTTAWGVGGRFYF